MRNGWNWKYPLSYMYPAYTQLVAKCSSPSIGDRRATGWSFLVFRSFIWINVFKNRIPIHILIMLSAPLFLEWAPNFSKLDKSNNLSRTNSHPQVLTMISALLFVDYEWCHVLFNNNTVIFLHIRWYYHILLNIHVVHYSLIFLCPLLQ